MTVPKFSYSQLGDSRWYRVTDSKDTETEYAHFSLIDAPHAKPPSSKHMELHFLENAAKEIIENGDTSFLLGIYAFVFDTVLQITHNLKGVQLCKIYSHDDYTKMVYRRLADKLSHTYEVKLYGNWIEILKK